MSDSLIRITNTSGQRLAWFEALKNMFSGDILFIMGTTDKEGMEKQGTILMMDKDEAIALRDWLNKHLEGDDE